MEKVMHPKSMVLINMSTHRVTMTMAVAMAMIVRHDALMRGMEMTTTKTKWTVTSVSDIAKCKCGGPTGALHALSDSNKDPAQQQRQQQTALTSISSNAEARPFSSRLLVSNVEC